MIRDLPAKSSTADYLPVSLLKSAVDVMAPLIARLANLSFSEGVFDPVFAEVWSSDTVALKIPELARWR